MSKRHVCPQKKNKKKKLQTNLAASVFDSFLDLDLDVPGLRACFLLSSFFKVTANNKDKVSFSFLHGIVPQLAYSYGGTERPCRKLGPLSAIYA